MLYDVLVPVRAERIKQSAKSSPRSNSHVGCECTLQSQKPKQTIWYCACGTGCGAYDNIICLLLVQIMISQLIWMMLLNMLPCNTIENHFSLANTVHPYDSKSQISEQISVKFLESDDKNANMHNIPYLFWPSAWRSWSLQLKPSLNISYLNRYLSNHVNYNEYIMFILPLSSIIVLSCVFY